MLRLSGNFDKLSADKVKNTSFPIYMTKKTCSYNKWSRRSRLSCTYFDLSIRIRVCGNSAAEKWSSVKLQKELGFLKQNLTEDLNEVVGEFFGLQANLRVSKTRK